MKIQIMGGKVCLRHKGKTLLGIVNKLFVFKSLLTTPSNVLPLQKAAAIQMLTTRWRVIRSNLLSLLKFSQLYVITTNPTCHQGKSKKFLGIIAAIIN